MVEIIYHPKQVLICSTALLLLYELLLLEVASLFPPAHILLLTPLLYGHLLSIVSCFIVAAATFDFLHDELTIYIQGQLDVGRVFGVLAELSLNLLLRLLVGHENLAFQLFALLVVQFTIQVVIVRHFGDLGGSLGALGHYVGRITRIVEICGRSIP